MGFISKFGKGTTTSFPGMNNGRAIWQEVFGNGSRSKEEAYKETPAVRAGGSYGRTTVSTDYAIKRLIQALRSNAPGGWTDDRYAQSQAFYGIAYVAIHRIATQLAQAEFQVFQKDESHPQGKVPAKSPQAKELISLLQHPNEEDSFGDILYSMSQQMDLTGMALTYMVPNAFGTPMQLFPIPTATAIPQPTINPDFPHGYYRIQPLYPYGPFGNYPTPNSSVGAAIPAQWMLRVKYQHPLLRYEGFSPMTAMNMQVDEFQAMERSRWYSMKRTFRPNMVLNMEEMEGAQPLPPEEIERIRAEIEDGFMGPENVGNLFVPAPGTKLEEFGSSPRDMDYASGWDQVSNFILGGGFGITKPAAGMVESSSYSTLFATLKQLYWQTLEPKANKIAAKLTRFLAPFFGDDLFIEIRCRRIDDHDVTFARMDKLIQGKAITKNELRLELDLPLTKEPWGDEIAGFEPPPEEPGAMPGLEEGQEGGSAIDDLESIMAGEQDENDMENSRPRYNEGNAGSLGPRKSLPEHLIKASSKTNGHHKNGHVGRGF